MLWITACMYKTLQISYKSWPICTSLTLRSQPKLMEPVWAYPHSVLLFKVKGVNISSDLLPFAAWILGVGKAFMVDIVEWICWVQDARSCGAVRREGDSSAGVPY